MVNFVVRSLFFIVIGVLMIMLREAFMPVIIQFVGAAFVVSGVISLFNVYVLRKRNLSRTFDEVVLGFVGVAGVAFGAWLLLSPSFFLSLLMLLLGGLLIVMGFYQLITLVAARKSVNVAAFMYVPPVVLMILGVFVIVNPFAASGLPFLIVGVGAVLSGIFDLITLFLFKRKRKEIE